MDCGESEVVIEASTCPYRARFEDVDTVYITVRLLSPAPNVIGVRLEHFRGLAKRGPTFAIPSDPSAKPEIVDDGEFVSLSSGGPTVRVERRDD
jgi:alpha-D-xyloside xylohydrolase